MQIHSVHKLIFEPHGKCLNSGTGRVFDAADYSLMKFGKASSAARYGHELGTSLAANLAPIIQTPRALCLLAAPYKYTPTASSFIAMGTLAAINAERAKSSLSPAQLLQVTKSSVGGLSYSSSSLEKREAELAAIDYLLLEGDLNSTHVIAIDDIRITGTAERKMAAFLDNFQTESITFAYYAECDEVLAKADPTLEHRLNTASISGLASVFELISTNDFVINTRVLKLFLSSDAELSHLIVNISTSLLLSIVVNAHGSGLEFMATYSKGIALVQKELNQRADQI